MTEFEFGESKVIILRRMKVGVLVSMGLLAALLLGCAGAFLGSSGIAPGDAVHFVDSAVDLLDALSLFLTGGTDLRDEFRHLLAEPNVLLFSRCFARQSPRGFPRCQGLSEGFPDVFSAKLPSRKSVKPGRLSGVHG